MANYNKLCSLYPIFAGAMLGTVLFLALFGYNILNPYYLSWYMAGNDPAQQLIGWLAFLRGSWSFPLCLTDSLIYPERVSIMFTDSIPLFAVIFKIASSLFKGSEFQFFGLYGLFVFIMQGILSAKITEHFTKNKIIILATSFLFILMPPLLYRIFGHHSLSSHYLILTALLIILKYYNKTDFFKEMLLWSLLISITPTVHLYFFPMVFCLLIAFTAYKIIKYKKAAYIVIPFFSVFCVFIALYFIGAFYGFRLSDGSAGGMGRYAFNFNGFINPLKALFSSVLPVRYVFGGQYEGFSYLGLGNILLVITGLFSCVYLIWRYMRLKDFIVDKTAVVIIILTIIGFVLLSSGGTISFDDKNILKTDLPKFMGTFRATGRFIWVAIYIILVISIYFAVQIQNRIKIKFIIPAVFILCALAQGYDLYEYSAYALNYNIITTLNNDGLQEQVNKRAEIPPNHSLGRQIEAMRNNGFESAVLLDKQMKYGYYFISNGMALKDFYLARVSPEMAAARKKYMEDLSNADIADNVFYVKHSDLLLPRDMKNKIYAYKAEPFVILTGRAADNMEQYRYDTPDKIDIMPKNNEYIKNGTDRSDNTRVLFKNGVSYAPTLAFAGDYILEVTGNNLDAVSIDPYSHRVLKHGKVTINEKRKDYLKAEINIPETSSEWEFRIYNKSENSVILRAVTLALNDM